MPKAPRMSTEARLSVSVTLAVSNTGPFVLFLLVGNGWHTPRGGGGVANLRDGGKSSFRISSVAN